MMMQFAEIPSIKRRKDKDRLPISVLITESGQITPLSFYGDDSWDLSPHWLNKNITPCNKKLVFSTIIFNDKSRLIDQKHATLCKNFKDFIYALLNEVSAAQVKFYFELAKPLLYWMVDVKGYRQFAEIQNCAEYAVFARFYQNKYSRKKQPSVYTIKSRLEVLVSLWKLKDKLHDSLTHPPWPYSSPAKMAHFCRTRDAEQTPVIPDNMWKKLMHIALENIRKNASDWLALKTTYDAIFESNLKRGHSRRVVANIASAHIRKLGTSGKQLRNYLRHLRTSCYIVIAGLTGIRQSEGLSIQKDCIHQSTIVINGYDLPVYYLQGKTYKYSGIKEGATVEWLANEEVNRAVTVLAQLTEPNRKAICVEIAALETLSPKQRSKPTIQKQLQEAKSIQHYLFLSEQDNTTHRVTAADMSNIGRWLTAFCQDYQITDEKGQLYPLKTHMFRRTLARFVARSRYGDIAMLREHFKHKTSDITLYYADGDIDPELTEMIEQEYQAKIFQLYSEVLDTEEPKAGGRGEKIVAHLKRINEGFRRSFLTAKNLTEMVAKTPDGTRFKLNAHSISVIGPDEKPCQPDCALNPLLCISCKNGVIMPSMLPFWEDYVRRLKACQNEHIASDGLVLAQKVVAQLKQGKIIDAKN